MKEKENYKMKCEYISSRTNQTIVSLAKLKDVRGRNESGLYLCEGYKLCVEALSNKAEIVYALLHEDKSENETFKKLCCECRGDIIVLSDGVFSKLTSDKAADGVIFVCRKKEIAAEIDDSDKICALDNIQDPGNVGTIMRTAAAMGFNTIIMHNCADIYNPKTVRASMGAIFKIKAIATDNPVLLLTLLKQNGRRIISAALCEGGLILGDAVLNKSDCPIFGNEGHGISKEILLISDATIKIPICANTESLNAAAAAAIILWEYGRL